MDRPDSRGDAVLKRAVAATWVVAVIAWGSTLGGCGTGPCGGCAPDEYCDAPDDLCGGGEPPACRSRPIVCTEEFEPVCTCDGRLAPNSCSAAMGGQDVDATGACVAEDPERFSCHGHVCEAHELCVRGLDGYPRPVCASPEGCAPDDCACLRSTLCGVTCTVIESHVELVCDPPECSTTSCGPGVPCCPTFVCDARTGMCGLDL